MEQLSGVRWTADDAPIVPERPNFRISTVGLADMLQLSGDAARARTLLRTVMARMQAEMHTGERSELWYYASMSIALALAGERDEALDWLERGVAAGPLRRGSGDFLAREPAFDRLHATPRFRALLEIVRQQSVKEHAELEVLRDSGVVPRRN
jgi:hypothetical protein